MNGVVEPRRYTPEDLLQMPDGDQYELVDGQLREHFMSIWACYVAGQLLARLRNYCQEQRAGWVVSGGVTYQCFPEDPGRVRKVAVSFLRLDRLSVQQAMARGHLRIAPDLAMEVVSPNDLFLEVLTKVQDFLAAGTRRVWVVHPETRFVHVYRADSPGTILREQDDLDGEDVVLGFRCRVGDLFLPPPGAAPA